MVQGLKEVEVGHLAVLELGLLAGVAAVVNKESAGLNIEG